MPEKEITPTDAEVTAMKVLEDMRNKMETAQEAVKELALMYGPLWEALDALRRERRDSDYIM